MTEASDWVKEALSIIGGGGLGSLATWWATRRKSDADADRTVAEAWAQFAAKMEARVTALETKVAQLEHELANREQVIVALAMGKPLNDKQRAILNAIVPGVEP